MSPREIDALVAEHCMGCVPCSCHPITRAMEPFPHYDSANGKCLRCHNHSATLYSTDPAASKQLRDEMRGKGWLYAIRVSGAGQVCAQIWRNGENRKAGPNYGDAIDSCELMAFALAALSAVGKPVAL